MFENFDLPLSGSGSKSTKQVISTAEPPAMSDTKIQINFDAPAILRKWPSIKNGRVSTADGGRPYLITEGTLDDCIREFMVKPASTHHLYEIHTVPQGELIGSVLSAISVVEIARLRDFL